MKVVCLDRAHGVDTKGKGSPDGTLREWKRSDEIVDMVKAGLEKRWPNEILVVDLVPEDKDILLTTRAARVNAICGKYGTNNVCCVSIHLNAGGDGKKWTTATGWEVWTSPGKTKGDDLATCLFNAARKWLPERFPMRADWSDGDPDKEEKFTILTRTKCAAALTENLFQDSTKDYPFICSEEGLMAIVNLHIDGIADYFKLPR